VQEVARRLAPLAASREVTLQADAGAALVMADAQRLHQVLHNLMHNAIVYNRPGGRVWVEATAMQREGVAGWSLCVGDDGRGLDAEQQAHLFEPFNRLGAERDGIDGRGLGLATAHQLVQLLHGHIDVCSARDQGSEFRVWLPAAAHAVAPAAGAAALSVLYIEDNPVNAMIVQELLAMRPAMRLRCAETGADGVRQALAEPPALVLVDMQLPDMDGHEVLRQLRAQGCTARLVVLSANAMPDEVQRARASGFDDYWTKPIDFGMFLEQLDRFASAHSDLGGVPS
jgi:CheY-like chemotaxis protein